MFDEDRYFSPGRQAPVFRFGDALLGVNICEDIWYAVGPTNAQSLAGAELIVNINASPFSEQKPAFRKKMLATRASDNHAIVAYVNMVGGQDELVFDGSSLVFDPGGELLCQGRAFEEDLLVVDLDVAGVFRERLHDPRRRKSHLLREVDQPAQVIEIASSRPRALTRPALPARSPVADLGLRRGDLQSIGPRHPRLRLQNGLPPGRAGAFGRGRFEPGRGRRRRRARPRKRPRREHAVALFEPGQHGRRRRPCLCAWYPLPGGAHRRAVHGLLDALSEVFRDQAPDATEENLQARIRGRS